MSKAAFLLLMIFMFWNTAPGAESKFEEFFSKTRFIMSKEEIEIFKHLPDDPAREDFIKEFWQKRDPSPDTPENEAFEEYQNRIEFANRYFRENRPVGYGWNTDRGRIILQLGIPEKRYFQGMNQQGQVEVFYYEYHQLIIEFVDRLGNGEYTLLNPPAALLTALDQEMKYLNFVGSEKKKNYLTFEAGWKSGVITVSIPVKRLTFQQDGDNLKSEIDILLYVYRDFKKTASSSFRKEISEPSVVILGKKELTFEIPLSVQEPGKYLVDIILKENVTNSRYRQVLTIKN